MSDQTGLIEWPDYLPYPQQEGFKYSIANKHRAVDVENGVSNLYYNPDTTNNIEISFILNENQKSYFETWYQGVLLNGYKWFNCPVVSFDGNSVTKQPVRQVPQSQREITVLSGGLNYKFKMKVLTRPVTAMPVEVLEYWPYYGGRKNFEYAADHLHKIVNYDAPQALNVPEL